MFDLVEEIAQADEMEIIWLLDAVVRRYGQLYPDWEISTIALEKSFDPKEQIEKMIAMLKKIKDDVYSG